MTMEESDKRIKEIRQIIKADKKIQGAIERYVASAFFNEKVYAA